MQQQLLRSQWPLPVATLSVSASQAATSDPAHARLASKMYVLHLQEWLDTEHVVIGTKCNRLLLLNTTTQKVRQCLASHANFLCTKELLHGCASSKQTDQGSLVDQHEMRGTQ